MVKKADQPKNVVNREVMENCFKKGQVHECEGCGEELVQFFLHFRANPLMPAFLIFFDNSDEVRYQGVEPNTPDYMTIQYVSHQLEGDIDDDSGMFNQECHPDSAVWCSYTKGSGVLEVTCYQCKEKVGIITLK